MAVKICFFEDDKLAFREELIEYKFSPGFSLTQKQKSINSLHESIKKQFPNIKILEVSTKSSVLLGQNLSAFRLKYKKKYVESIFQSSKVFYNEGKEKQFSFLIDYEPSAAKKYIKENPGILKEFSYENKIFPLEPKSLFYDYIYCLALRENKIDDALVEYNCFTDIEFNHKKQINCQARACAIYVYLLKNDLVKKSLDNIEEFKKIYEVNSEKEYNLFTV